VSESAEQSTPLSLEVVRARIFYLACDIEPVSPPAAMLLRAVADAIDDSDITEEFAPSVATNDALDAVLSHASAMRSLGSRMRDVATVPERRLGIVSSQSSFKR